MSTNEKMKEIFEELYGKENTDKDKKPSPACTAHDSLSPERVLAVGPNRNNDIDYYWASGAHMSIVLTKEHGQPSLHACIGFFSTNTPKEFGSKGPDLCATLNYDSLPDRKGCMKICAQFLSRTPDEIKKLLSSSGGMIQENHVVVKEIQPGKLTFDDYVSLNANRTK